MPGIYEIVLLGPLDSTPSACWLGCRGWQPGEPLATAGPAMDWGQGETAGWRLNGLKPLNLAILLPATTHNIVPQRLNSTKNRTF